MGKTETVKNTVNPSYKESIVVHYQFEIDQRISFEVEEDDDKDTVIGVLETTLGDIMGKKDFLMQADLHKKDTTEKRGVITIKAVPMKESNILVCLKLNGTNIPLNDGCCITPHLNPYVTISRFVPDG